MTLLQPNGKAVVKSEKTTFMGKNLVYPCSLKKALLSMDGKDS